MPELINDSYQKFNKDFLKFRKKYYFNETKELLARHKLLTAFIICLLAPGIKSIQAIGVPFYTMIEPSSSLSVKLLFLMPLLFFLIVLTKAQSKFIKGGTFRDYLDTLYMPSTVYKKIDMVILLLSLNVVWIAILFGAGKLYQLPARPVLLFSYYCLYCSMLMAIVVLLLNSLYKNTGGVLILTFSLILIAAVSLKEVWVLNVTTALGVGLLSAAIALKVQPYKKKNKHVKISNKEQLTGLAANSSPRVLFLTQIATFRANKNTFFIRIALCTFLSAISFNLFFSYELSGNRTSLLLILISIESYILSTLFTFFAKDELDYAVFYSIFPYQSFSRQPIEIVIVSGILILSIMPIIVFSLFTTPPAILSLILILTMNVITIAVNRVLYACSLRFCLFTALLNTIGHTLMQYLLIGAFFGN
ncbi:hypothetical protein [Legionella yabuuchiae]|uniref:hypothetical protein n=1 Tax=Legionella yabuuchiae TaxID=376727 RepID=UPI001054DA44|nr:hypothetical protein [Legionella yabuuchiae]